MTNDAPERIWALYGWSEVLSFNVYYNGGTEYIRADHAQAEKEAAVAAEREACAEVARLAMDAADEKRKRDRGPAFISYAASAEVILRRIRDRSNTDALAARDAQVRAEALREAADMARRMSLNFAEQAYDAPNPERDFGKVDGAIKVEEVILALIPSSNPTNQKHDEQGELE